MYGKEQTVGFAKKNCAYSLPGSRVWRCRCRWEHGSGGAICPRLWILATTDPLRGSSLWLWLSPSCASGFAFRLQVNHNMPAPMAGVKCLFGCFARLSCGGGGWVQVCGFSSDLDLNRAVLWSKSEMKHLKHLKHLKHPKLCLWMFGLLFCQHFKELGGKVKDGGCVGQDQKGMLLVLWVDIGYRPNRYNRSDEWHRGCDQLQILNFCTEGLSPCTKKLTFG